MCSDADGYYYADSIGDIDETIAQLNSRITKISNAKNGLLQASSNLGKTNMISIEIKLSVG
jgi:prefoldin subunit 5